MIKDVIIRMRFIEDLEGYPETGFGEVSGSGKASALRTTEKERTIRSGGPAGTAA